MPWSRWGDQTLTILASRSAMAWLAWSARWASRSMRCSKEALQPDAAPP